MSLCMRHEQADVLVYEARRAVLLHPVLYLAPLGDEVLDVAAQALDVAVLGDGPDDYAEALGPYLLRDGAQARALFVARDALRDAGLVPAGNQHHVAPRERYARRYARALALARVLDDLHEHIHARAHLFALAPRLRNAEFMPGSTLSTRALYISPVRWCSSIRSMKKSQSFPLSSVIAILVSSGSMRFAIIFFDHPAMMQKPPKRAGRRNVFLRPIRRRRARERLDEEPRAAVLEVAHRDKHGAVLDAAVKKRVYAPGLPGQRRGLFFSEESRSAAHAVKRRLRELREAHAVDFRPFQYFQPAGQSFAPPAGSFRIPLLEPEIRGLGEPLDAYRKRRREAYPRVRREALRKFLNEAGAARRARKHHGQVHVVDEDEEPALLE